MAGAGVIVEGDRRRRMRQGLTEDELVSALEGAVYDREFDVEYQPIVRLDGMVVVRGEALLRWRSPLVGIVDPEVFIPAAEGAGLMEGIGKWVLGRAAQDAAGWRASIGDVMVAVNVSPKQFEAGVVMSTVQAALEKSGLPAGMLEIEVTEGPSAKDFRSEVRALRDAGIAVALDDFGTGYSGYQRLVDWPVTALKIDRRFVDGGGSTEELLKRRICSESLFRLGTRLNLTTVAEGLEHAAQVAFVRALGCTEGQGWVISPPLRHSVTASQFVQFVRGVKDLASGENDA